MKKVFITIALLLAAGAASILPVSFSAPASGSLIQKSIVIDFENLAPAQYPINTRIWVSPSITRWFLIIDDCQASRTRE